MRFGLFYQASEADGQTHAERYAEMLDLIALGDTLGFDVAWLAELHFGGAFSLLASPLMVVPVIAQRTRRIRIGTAVTLLEYLPSLVPLEDRDVSQLVEKSFTRRGIKVMTKARFEATKVQVTKDGVCVDVGPEGGPTEEVKAEVMLVATGRAANASSRRPTSSWPPAHG